MLQLMGALHAAGWAAGPGGCSVRGASAPCCPSCTRTSAALGSGHPADVQRGGMAEKAPPVPLLLPQGTAVAEYLQREYGDGVVLRKW